MAKLEMTPAVKKALEGLLPFTAGSKIPFTPPAFMAKAIPDKARPVLYLRPATADERYEAMAIMQKVTSRLMTKRDPDEADGKRITELARKWTVGWERLYALDTGNEIAYEAGPDGSAKAEMFELFPFVMDVFYYCVQLAGLSDVEKLGLRY